MTIERPMFPPRAESVGSFSHQPATGQSDGQALLGDSPKPAEEPANVVDFRVRRKHHIGTPVPMPDDYFMQHFSMSFFKLPFVTLPQEPFDTWGEFWERVDMWNDEPTDNSCADYHRGRKYAQAAVEALVADRVGTRQLEIVVECMIEGAFRRRGPKGALCRKLSSAEHGFLQGLCKIAVGGR
jgi:hypothetical protein